MASAPAMVMMRLITPMSTASPVIFGMKSGLQPCIGCGLNAGLGLAGEPSGLRSCLRAAGEHRRVGRLADNDLGVGPLLGQHARDAFERAAGAEAGDPVVELLALEVVDDLARGGARMHVGIGFVLELARQEPAVRLGELLRLVDHADAALGRRREHHLGAEEAHQLAALDAEGLRHRDDQRIALRGADHREPDAGVAGGRLDHGLPGLELAGLFRGLDDAERQAILDRAERIEGLDLDEQVDAFRRQLVDLDHRRVADGFKNVCEFGHYSLPYPSDVTYSARARRRRAPLPSSSPTTSDAGRRCASVLLPSSPGSWRRRNPGSAR